MGKERKERKNMTFIVFSPLSILKEVVRRPCTAFLKCVLEYHANILLENIENIENIDCMSGKYKNVKQES